MKCEHCQKEFTAGSSYKNHIRRCPSNPNKIHEVLTDDGRKRIRDASIAWSSKRWSDPSVRERHSIIMKAAVKNNPDAYTSSNRGRTKQIEIDGLKLQGQWEVDFYVWAKNNGLKPERPRQPFAYEWNGTRWYHPDFYLPVLDVFVEVKGYETERDRAKWLHFPEELVIIKAKEISEIRQGTYKWANNLEA